MVADEIIAAGGSAEVLACHIGDMAQIESTFAQIQAKHGRLDILIDRKSVV